MWPHVVTSRPEYHSFSCFFHVAAIASTATEANLIFVFGGLMKKVLYGVLMLGWIPTLAVVTGARWIGGQSVSAQGNTPVKVTRLYTGPDGKTKVEEFQIPLSPRDRGSDVSGSAGLTS